MNLSSLLGQRTAPGKPAAVAAPAATPPGARPGPRAVLVREPAALADHLKAWEALAHNAAEPNVFHEHWFLRPALEAFAGRDELSFLLVYGPPPVGPAGHDVLWGFFPMVRRRLSRLAPLDVLQPWEHPYGFLPNPLVHAACADASLAFFLDWARHDRRSALVRFDGASADGPVSHALTRVANERRRPSFVVEEYSRALFRPRASAEEYQNAVLSGKRRKEIRRQERLLSAHGPLATRVLGPGDDPEPWIEAFLALEAAGWKGREGTALGSKPADAQFFRAMTRGAFERGRLQMLGLFLGGRPLALKVNLLAPPGAFAFKIAFDETFAHQSPGVLLELANIDLLHQSPRPAEWMDSCAVAGHSMIDRLWPDRRAIRTAYLATGRPPGDLAVALFPLARWLKRKLPRRAAKTTPAHPAAEE